MKLKKKDWGIIGAALAAAAATYFTGGAAAPAAAGLLEGAAGAGAAGAGAAGAGAAGASAAGAGAGGLLGEGAMTALLTPGLSSTGAGSQAAMLAAQNSGLGLGAMVDTASAAASAPGAGANYLGMADKALTGMGKVAPVAGLLSPQPQQDPGPRPQQAPAQPMPQFGGYEPVQPSKMMGASSLPGAGMMGQLPPELIAELKKRGLI